MGLAFAMTNLRNSFNYTLAGHMEHKLFSADKKRFEHADDEMCSMCAT